MNPFLMPYLEGTRWEQNGGPFLHAYSYPRPHQFLVGYQITNQRFYVLTLGSSLVFTTVRLTVGSGFGPKRHQQWLRPFVDLIKDTMEIDIHQRPQAAKCSKYLCQILDQQASYGDI